jgi:hypothetical protein
MAATGGALLHFHVAPERRTAGIHDDAVEFHLLVYGGAKRTLTPWASVTTASWSAAIFSVQGQTQKSFGQHRGEW